MIYEIIPLSFHPQV